MRPSVDSNAPREASTAPQQATQLVRRELRSVKRNKAVLGARTGMILGQMIIYGLLFWQVLRVA